MLGRGLLERLLHFHFPCDVDHHAFPDRPLAGPLPRQGFDHHPADLASHDDAAPPEKRGLVSHHKRVERDKPFHIIGMYAPESERRIGHHSRPVKLEHREPAGAAERKIGLADRVEFDGVGANRDVFGQLVGHLGIGHGPRLRDRPRQRRVTGIRFCKILILIEIHGGQQRSAFASLLAYRTGSDFGVSLSNERLEPTKPITAAKLPDAGAVCGRV